MTKVLCKKDYEEQTAVSRDKRMEWFRAARFGMMIHYGIIELEFDETPKHQPFGHYPQLNGGCDYSNEF